jgi:hypothetical protein
VNCRNHLEVGNPLLKVVIEMNPLTNPHDTAASTGLHAAPAAAMTADPGAMFSGDGSSQRSVRKKPRGFVTAPLHVRASFDSSRGDQVIVIPAEDVLHCPQGPPAIADSVAWPIYLCCQFNIETGPESCPAGANCPFVHADLRRAQRFQPHNRGAWNALEDVPYPRLSGGGPSFAIAAPNKTVAKEHIPSEMIIRTRALESGREPLSHCAHFVRKGVCDLGADCLFIHAVRLAGANAVHRPIKPPKAEGRSGTAAPLSGATLPAVCVGVTARPLEAAAGGPDGYHPPQRTGADSGQLPSFDALISTFDAPMLAAVAGLCGVGPGASGSSHATGDGSSSSRPSNERRGRFFHNPYRATPLPPK